MIFKAIHKNLSGELRGVESIEYRQTDTKSYLWYMVQSITIKYHLVSSFTNTDISVLDYATWLKLCIFVHRKLSDNPGKKPNGATLRTRKRSRFIFIFTRGRSLAHKITRFKAGLIGGTQIFTWFSPSDLENCYPQHPPLILSAENAICFTCHIFSSI